MRRRPAAAPRRYLFGAAGLAIPLSQVGHSLAYLMRYGPAGFRLETEGVHAYFPAMLRSSGLALGLFLLAALLVIGGGRLLLGRGLGLSLHRHRIVDLLVVGAVVQLDLYLVQESLEALAAHEVYSFTLLGTIIGWGLVGQLPVAALAALALGWLSARLEVSLQGLRTAWALALRPLSPVPAVPVRILPPVTSAVPLALRVGHGGIAKRGPPLLLS